MLNIDKNKFIKTCNSVKTMAEAARLLNMHFNTFKRYAIMFNCYNTNQSHKGIKIGSHKDRVKTIDILNGKYPDYQTFKLKIRLIDEHIKDDKCEICGWNEKRIGDLYTPCELHHKDGDSHNHTLSNLIMLCPNCHSLTQNYRSKNKKY